MYIAPYVPHTFASRSQKCEGHIVAITFSDKITNEVQDQILNFEKKKIKQVIFNRNFKSQNKKKKTKPENEFYFISNMMRFSSILFLVGGVHAVRMEADGDQDPGLVLVLELEGVLVWRRRAGAQIATFLSCFWAPCKAPKIHTR